MREVTRKETQALTRRRLKEVAQLALESEGAAGFGIEHIVRQAGYSRGAFYANFASKADLLLEIVQDQVPDELQFWNIVFEQADDPEACLASVISDSQELSRGRALAKLQLQLEAERDKDFRLRYQAYLHGVYAEQRKLFDTILRRHGKATPPDIDLKVAGVYALGSILGLRSTLGFRSDHREASFELMHDYIRHVIESAPAEHENGGVGRTDDIGTETIPRGSDIALMHSQQNFET